MLSAEIERSLPYVVPIIMRSHLDYGTRGALNEKLEGLGDRHRGQFNGVETHHMQTEWAACVLREYVTERRLHRLVPGSDEGATLDQVVAAWKEIEKDRQAALAWARAKGVLQEVVQEYRYERHRGSYSGTAHEAAGWLVAKLDATVANPLTRAGYLIEWAEREHRAWFWRCCRSHHVL